MNKTAIKNFAIWSRVTLIDAVKQKAFEYDITEQGGDSSAVAVGGRLLTEAEKKQRAALISQIAYKGFEQVMEEAAYTWFNRFIALRYMEVNNFLPLKIRLFSDENDEFNPEILKEAMNIELDGIDKNIIFDLIEKQDNEKLYKYLLIAQCNALGECLPGMFEKIEDYTELLFPNNLLKSGSVLDKMVTEIPTEDWEDAVQIIGWMYQYYNAEPKDELINAHKKYKKNDIPFVTQLFTPDWIVRYMVENSLGRIFIVDSGKWLVDSMTEAERAAKEKEIAESLGWKYYLPEAEQTEEVRVQLNAVHNSSDFDVTKIKIIDPCMGSGHILVYAFDVLMQMYSECGWSERDAAKSILENNLYGLDIDDRAGQLAYFAVMMKARKYNRRILTSEIKPNVMAIQESNNFNSDYLSLFGELKAKAQMLLNNMNDAKELGSIIQIKLPVEDLSALKEKAEEIKNNYYDNFFDTARQAGVVTDFVPLINQAIILAQKYDVVVTNPPYMNSSLMTDKVKIFINSNYEQYKSDLFSAFIAKSLDICNINGHIGMVTPYVWMFISSYEDLRNLINKKSNISSLVQLEYNAFEAACVPVCTFTLQKTKVRYTGEYIKLSDFRGAENQAPKTIEAVNNKQCGYRFSACQDNFSKIPGSPIAYWVSENFSNNYDKDLFSQYSTVITGMTIGDNNKYLRLWFEVNNKRISLYSKSMQEINILETNWIPYSKGGPRRNWYGNYDYVVDWSSKHNFNRSKTTLQHLYLKEALTWPFITSGDFSARLLPNGFLWDVAGSPCFFSDKNIELYSLAFLCSKAANYILKVVNPTINIQAVDIAQLPLIVENQSMDNVMEKTQDNILISTSDWDSFETSWDFKKHPLV